MPTAPVTLPATIEVMPPYQPQTFCSQWEKPGTKALANLLTATYKNTAIIDTVRPCGTDTSEHYDGRAIDWGVDVANKKQHSQGKAFLKWLFATDSDGNSYAMVRRLGIMYVIWNKKIWGAWDSKWEPYSCSGRTACHQNHMHISLDWSGAMKKTSFWTGKVRPPMPPPLQPITKLHTPVTQTVSPRDAAPQPVYKLVAGARYRVSVLGTYNFDGVRHHRADATCSTTDGKTWSRALPETVTDVTGALDLSVNGQHNWHPTGTVAQGCSAEHTYRMSVTIGSKAQPLAMVLDDPNQWRAAGQLTVTVERIH